MAIETVQRDAFIYADAQYFDVDGGIGPEFDRIDEVEEEFALRTLGREGGVGQQRARVDMQKIGCPVVGRLDGQVIISCRVDLAAVEVED